MRGRDQESIAAAHAALAAEGVIEPLSTEEGEARRWLDFELASLVENRFFVSLDPTAIGDAERAAWEPRASSDEPLSSPHGQAWYRRAYWLLDEGARAGTMALSTGYTAIGLVTVSSLYTMPSRRRRGIAARALRRAHEAVKAQGGRGIRVPAYWAWQPAVRFYLGLGMWVANWKHAIVLAWDDAAPRYEITRGEGVASISIGGGAEIVARDEGARLGWSVSPAMRESPHFSRAQQTLAVAIATLGYPLVRSEEAWAARLRSSDGGEPEGLAMKIAGWEAEDRAQGYELRVPAIPGLPRG